MPLFDLMTEDDFYIVICHHAHFPSLILKCLMIDPVQCFHNEEICKDIP